MDQLWQASSSTDSPLKRVLFKSSCLTHPTASVYYKIQPIAEADMGDETGISIGDWKGRRS